LAGLEQVIGLPTVRQVLSETGRINPRACKLTHEVTLWIVLAMGIFTNSPIRQVFKRTGFRSTAVFRFSSVAFPSATRARSIPSKNGTKPCFGKWARNGPNHAAIESTLASSSKW